MKFITKQEQLWFSKFGDDYIDRNMSDALFYSKVAMFSNILKSAHGINSLREFGCNIGLNLLAIKKIKPEIDLFGIEINQKAAQKAAELNIAHIANDTALNLHIEPKVDIVISVGFLIHVNPESLNKIYDNLYNGTNKYILLVEYFSPNPVELNYRGEQEALFKRDFAGEMLEKYKLKLVDYGFIYNKDNWSPQDNLNWFLLEK
jgi:pseudaminic acid biosynthesis-associated methylase